MYLILFKEHANPRRQLLDRILLLFHHVGQVEADGANVDPSLGKVHLRHVVVVGVVQQRLERERGGEGQKVKYIFTKLILYVTCPIVTLS